MRLSKYVWANAIMILTVILTVNNCTEEPTPTNPYDPNVNEPPYLMAGNIYFTENIPSISSFSVSLTLENFDASNFKGISLPKRKNAEIIYHIDSPNIKLNWVNTNSPLNLNRSDTLMIIRWEVNKALSENPLVTTDYTFVNAETGNLVENVDLKAKVVVEE